MNDPTLDSQRCARQEGIECGNAGERDFAELRPKREHAAQTESPTGAPVPL